MNNQKLGLLVLGGAAYKIISGMAELELDSTVTPKLVPLYVDTASTETKYVLDGETPNVINTGTGLSGSGGDRSHNLAAIKSQMPGIIATYINDNPDINIVNVVFSSGGGSGSTLAFVAIQQLVAEGLSVICYVSNTPNSLHRSINAVATISSINNLAAKNNVVIPVMPYNTIMHDSFKDADTLLLQDLVCVASLLHADNIGVDDGDRKTALNPMLGVKDVVKPGVKFMQIHFGYNYPATYPVLSTLTFCLEGTNDDIGTDAINIFSGVLNEGLKDTYLDNSDAISLVIAEGRLNEWINDMNGIVDKYKKAASTAYVGEEIGITNSVSTTTDDDGFTA